MRKNVLTTIASVTFILIAGTAFAYNPPSGSSVLYDLYSPVFLGGGVSPVSTQSPAADALNPAAAGDEQRFTLDASYLALIGLPADPGWGHILNAGVVWPTRVGVLSGSARFVTAPFVGVALAPFGAVNVSFSKDLFPTLLVGLGLAGQFGADWALGADLGFVHKPGNLAFLKDFRWGVSVRGMGKGFAPGGYTSFPEIFTPALGASFNLVEAGPFRWSWGTGLSFPSFQDLRFSLGTQLDIADMVALRVATGFDLRDRPRSIPVSFGLGVKLAPSIRNDQSELATNLAAAPLQNGIWAAGAGANLKFGLLDRKPPEITLDTKQEYISPNLDGVQDDLVKSLKIVDQRYVKGYRFVVTDAQGAQVREIVNKDERPENVTVKNVLARLTYVKTGISVPEQVRWDGRSDTGTVVPDGTYTYQVEAWDDNGNVGKSQVGTVVVDSTPPSVEVSVPYQIFSPNDDGNKDVLPVEQSGSKELLWTGEIRNNAGEKVLSLSWENSDPASFSWDGTNDSGVLAPDGVYSYRVTATDLGGNSASAEVDNILINTQATPINITISGSYFSPNGDGIKDSIDFRLGVPVKTGIERWVLTVATPAGQARRTFAGSGSIPETVTFDGKSDSGQVLPEGNYVGKLEVRYENGNSPDAVSPPLAIDLTAPSASVSADLSIFSPDGDGNRDTLTIYQETSEEPQWTGTIQDVDGNTVRSFTWRGRADSTVQWAGRDEKGQLVPDGLYFYEVNATDRAGNSGASKRLRFELNTEATDVFVTVDQNTFSPNMDGVKDRITVRPNLKVTEGVEYYEMRILQSPKGGEGQVVRNVRVQGKAPGDYVWDGLDNGGRRVPDGSYVAELEVKYLKGDFHKVRTSPFVVDTTAPTVEITVPDPLFSPDGDGLKDQVTIQQRSSDEQLWEGEIRSAAGATVRTFFWKGQAAAFAWDGKDENGNKIPDGTYSYRVSATDQAGNSVSRQVTGLIIDTRATPVFLTVSRDGFSPNGDGVLDTVELKPIVGLAEGIVSWTLQLVSKEGGVQKTFSGKAAVPASIVWDGKADSGDTAREGLYQAVLRMVYAKGNQPEAQSTPFVLDVSAPQVNLTLSPQPFSPDNDGVDDELTVGIKVQDISPVASWGIKIEDPVGHLFSDFKGRGTPAERIIWNGVSNTGELVQAAEDYPLIFTIADRLGNAATVRKTIAVDVLVIREGDKLKVRISSITFPPNSADLKAVEDPEKVLKNDKTLQRLAEIFKKYDTYKIRIEGHANNLSWEDPAKAAAEEREELQPLSLARAEAVKAALVALGLNADRISTAGLGGTSPVVPFSDTENRWKNRRVEFILVKK